MKVVFNLNNYSLFEFLKIPSYAIAGGGYNLVGTSKNTLLGKRMPMSAQYEAL